MELSNIHRQVAHPEAAVGKHKADSAAAAARALNSSIQASLTSMRLSSQTVGRRTHCAVCQRPTVVQSCRADAVALRQAGCHCRRQRQPSTRHKTLHIAKLCTRLPAQVDVHRVGLTPGNALGLVREYDIVIDASDNAPTR